MKKRILVLILAALMVFTSQMYTLITAADGYIADEGDAPNALVPTETMYNGIGYAYATAGVYTTNGTAVSYYIAQSDFSAAAKQAFLETTLEDYNVISIAPASAYYNCHSYAWHQASASNTAWITDIQPYLNDPHCEESPNPQAGAIAVYRKSDGSPEHSAIVVRVEADGDVICRSKWGPAGVYEHEANEVPNEYMANPYAGIPDIAYYSYSRIHTWSYAYTASSHTRSCLICGVRVTEPHTFIGFTNRCGDCGYQGNGQIPIGRVIHICGETCTHENSLS